MAITTATPQPVETLTANKFEIAHYDVSNPPSGYQFNVWWNAINVDAGGNETIVKNCGPVMAEGDELTALCADALSRAKAYETAGQPAGIAYQLGQRDAIYAWLQTKPNGIPAAS